MKIIHISPSYKPASIYGGPIVSVSSLCQALTSRYKVEVMTTTANGKTELQVLNQSPIIIDGVTVQYFKRVTKDPTHLSPLLLWNLNQKLRKNRTNTVVHIHSWWNFVAILSCLVTIVNHVPVVLSPRGMLTSYTLSNRNTIFKSLIHGIIGKFLISCCHIHATSEQEKQDILQTCAPKSINIIPNFICLPFKTSNLPPPFHTPVIFKLIFLSRIEEKKGLEFLFKSLATAGFPWKLTIAGTGKNNYIENLKRLAHLLGITASIHWIGHVTDKNKHQILASHNLLVLFSYNENFANVVIESLASGTPVAISNNVGLADYIIEKDLGWVSNLNCVAITQALNDAFQDIKKRTRINKTAPSLIRNHFSKHQLLKQYSQLYQNLI